MTKWVAIKLFLGRLLRTSKIYKFVLDVSPGNEKYVIHLWCEARDHDPVLISFKSRFEVQAELATSGGDSGRYVIAANFDCSSVTATANRHRDHDRSLCNVTKHGDKLLAEVAKLECCAATIIGRRIEEWNRCISPESESRP